MRDASPDVVSRYRGASDEQLRGLLRDGEESFVPAAWASLQQEASSRGIAVDEYGAEREGAPAAADAVSPGAVARRIAETGRTAFGLGGWLVLFLLWTVGGAGVLARMGIGMMRADVLLGTLALAVCLVLAVGVLLVITRSSFARPFWIALLIPMAVLALAAALLTTPFRWTALLSPAASLAWARYWICSRRVRATFGTRAMGPGTINEGA